MSPLGPRGSWKYWKCVQTNPIQCACEKQDPIYLKLRGRCKDSVIDTYWTPQNQEGQYFLHGIKSSEIRYDKESNNWKLKAIIQGDEFSTASSEATLHSFLLGKSKWIITNDKSTRISRNKLR